MNAVMNKEQLKSEIARNQKALRKLEAAEKQKIRDTQITPTEEGKLLARYREVKSLLTMAENEYNSVKTVHDGLEARVINLRERKFKLEEKAEKAGIKL